MKHKPFGILFLLSLKLHSLTARHTALNILVPLSVAKAKLLAHDFQTQKREYLILSVVYVYLITIMIYLNKLILLLAVVWSPLTQEEKYLLADTCSRFFFSVL